MEISSCILSILKNALLNTSVTYRDHAMQSKAPAT